MRWQPSRLVSTLKSSTRSARTEEKNTRQEPLPIREAPVSREAPSQQRWHEDVKRCGDVLEFLFNGRPPFDVQRARSLSRPTSDYLSAVAPTIVRPSIECDLILTTLLNEHASNDPATHSVAVLACIYDLSLPKATEHLISLDDLDPARYLRCLVVASQIKSSIISIDELRIVRLLLVIISGQAQGLQEFGQLVQSCSSNGRLVFLDLQMVDNILARSRIHNRLYSQISTCLDQRQYMSAYGLVSWLQTIIDTPNNDGMIRLLNAHFDCWSWLSIWRPDHDRIQVWERSTLSAVQRGKLNDIFKLDGPDNQTKLQPCLGLVESQCYEYARIDPESPESLERYLDALYKACLIGPYSVDLFIEQCVGKVVTVDVLSMVEGAMGAGTDSHCKGLLDFSRALERHPNLTADVRRLINSVASLESFNIPESYQPLMNQLSDRLCNTVQLAQHEFCQQLQAGPADFMGMLIHELGMAILKATRIHPILPPELLDNIKRFPQENALDAIFDELQNDKENSAAHSSRFKTYLLSSLGGNGSAESGSVTLANVQDEIKFWKGHPDILRRDLAKKLGEIRGLDYSLYITCLHAMRNEHDLYLGEMKNIMVPDDEQTGLKFAAYLAYRRGLRQLQNECWLLLMTSLLRSQKPSFLPKMADSVSFMEWDKLVGDLERLLAPVQDQLPESGPGLTRERMAWWKTLAEYSQAVKFLLQMHGTQRNLRWLYFPVSSDHVMPLLRVAAQGESMSSMDSQIISYLRRNGSNAIEVCDCIRLVSSTSELGAAVCQRFLSREEISQWTDTELHMIFIAWSQHESMDSDDKSALESIRQLLRLPVSTTVQTGSIRSTNELLQSEYDTLFKEARKLESLRLRLQHQNPQRVSSLLSEIGVDNITSGRVVDDRIPGELVDAIDEVGDNQYEFSFALTGLSDLQRSARGIHKDSRLLLVRICLQGEPRFCIHFSPNDEGSANHKYWQPSSNREGPAASCTTAPTLFTYYLGRNLHNHLQGQFSFQSLYDAIQTLIIAHPTACLVCTSSIGTKLWKPSTCSIACSRQLRLAPLEVRLHNLITDPPAMDLLLTCVYAAAGDASTLELLPGCPVAKTRITTVIDSLPALANFKTTANLQAVIRGSDGLGKEREDLLSWLCMRFRGFLISASSGSRVPSMPNTQQFLMPNTSHEREALFNTQAPTTGSGRVIFHGTQVSRLFLILTEGLKVMSNTPFMLTGAARGAGIYCGDDQATSLPYSGITGPSWKNSTMGNMKVMLGCELATPGPSPLGTYHVVPDENSMVIRYIFLLPANFTCPPRHHVEPAMSTVFASLRAGTLV